MARKIAVLILYSVLCGMVTIILLHDILTGNEWYYYLIEALSIFGCIFTVIFTSKEIIGRDKL